ncbi:uncharacterized protein LOC141695927 [Apium graveolens]|uniref:uncharacterized protein LOC141695927 n=1 Tax=Apium graveolens TaxID=4045 RepID=UPI003D7B09E5
MIVNKNISRNISNIGYVQCKVFDFSNNHIDVVIKDFPERERKQAFWALIRSLASVSQLPWCLFGDFNDMLYISDKKGKNKHPQNLLDGFRQTIEDSSLVEVDLKGGDFTWEKSKDHDPIKLELINTAISKKQFRFMFENTWLKESSFHADVSNYWQKLPVSHLLPKLLFVSKYMTKWGRVFFHKFREKVVEQKETIDSLENREDDDGVQMYYDEVDKLNELLAHEEAYWRQRAKAFWS